MKYLHTGQNHHITCWFNQPPLYSGLMLDHAPAAIIRDPDQENVVLNMIMNSSNASFGEFGKFNVRKYNGKDEKPHKNIAESIIC